MPVISVIVPVYNVEKYIHRCIDSILNQTFTNFELILVDDGSPDNCGKICDEYAIKDNRIHVIHQENGGLSAARNAGIDWAMNNSDSEWITFIDSDDWIHPDYLQLLYKSAIESSLNLSICNYKRVDSFEEYNIFSSTDYKILHSEEAYCSYYELCMTATFKLFKRVLFKDIRFPIGKLCEDAFTIYKILFSLDSVAITDIPLYYYFINDNSIIRSAWSPKRLDEVVAHEGQLEFLQKNCYNDAYNYELFRYLKVLFNQTWHIKNSYNNKDKAKYLKYLAKKMRNTIRIYKKIHAMPIDEYMCFYELAYPKLIIIYLYSKKILRILKR